MKPFFAFLNGALDYDCVRCGAKCCHGLGLGAHKTQDLPQLVELRPDLVHFTSNSYFDRNLADLYTYRTGCWFLKPDGWCGIEVEHGRRAKPMICKLFPFSHLRRFGDRLVVAPQLECPLTVAPNDAPSLNSDYDALQALIQEYALKPEDIPRLGSEEWDGAFVTREIQARALTEPYVRGEHQGDLFRDMLDEHPVPGPDLDQRRQGWQVLLQVPARPQLPPETTRLLAALSPGLRIHHYLDWGPIQAPLFLAALEFYLGLAHAVGDLSITPPAIQRMLRSLEPIFQLMVHLEDVPEAIEPETLTQFAQSSGPGPLAAIFQAVVHNTTRPLGALLQPILGLYGTLRIDLLRMIGQVLAATVRYIPVSL